MENFVTILNFEAADGTTQEVNSPRSLEACLRSGYDPSELLPRPRSYFKENKTMNEDMLDIKYKQFERKRLEKIETVKQAREDIIIYSEKHQSNNDSYTPAAVNNTKGENDNVNHMLELEQKRMEAVRRRQEKEMAKIIQRESAMVTLQAKIQKAENEEHRKKREHEKKVQEQKAASEKKKAQRAKDMAQKEYEDQQRRRELARKEAEFERKKQKADEAAAQQLLLEARERERERELRMEEYRQKTAALLKAQADEAERNRQIMQEREARVKAQMDAKVAAKKEEILHKRELAVVRIKDALAKHHELHEQKKQAFNEHTRAAKIRAKELEVESREALKKQADDREKRNKLRYNRLVDAYRIRQDHRQDIIRRRKEKDSVFAKIQQQREEENTMHKFMNEVKKQDKQENVERVARLNEFLRLQTMQRVHEADLRYEKIQYDKLELQRRHREEAKQSLTRKHQIANAMDMMRVTNDYTLLDQLFSDKKNRRRTKKNDDGDGDERLNQTA